MSSKTFLGSASVATFVLGSLCASLCWADYTEELGVSLEWLTDSSQAIAVVAPVEKRECNWGWPMRIVRILKADPRIEIGQIHRVRDKFHRPTPLDRCMIFFRADEEGELFIHETCGYYIHAVYHDTGGIKLYGFDREGRFVRSLDQAIDIVTRRVKRGPNRPEPDYSKANRYKEPFKGGFYRMAEDDFDSFYYMVLVPADPDFKPMLEVQSGLPIGYIRPGTLDKNYPGDRGPISDRPLAGKEATATVVEVLREIAPQMSRRGMVVHSRRGVGDALSYEEPTDRRAFVASPDGKLLLAGVTRSGRYTSLLDAETGKTLFSGEIYHQFSPRGTFFVARQSDSAYGIWRSDNRKLVCELAPKRTGLYIDSSTLRFTADERTVFCSRMGEESSSLAVFDLETGEQISERIVRNPFLRIRDVYPGSTFLMTNRVNGPGHHFFNWRTGQFEHHLDPSCQLPEISPNDETVAYVRSEPSDDGITPAAITLVIEELASHRALRAIELPCMPRELRFIADGQTVMTILEVTARQHRRNVALLYGIQPSDMDGETISWTPCSY